MAGIYLHVPFCRSKCAYCDFFSKRAKDGEIERYLDIVADEWSRRREEIAGEKVTTIYIGGGTPSILTPQQLGGLLSLFPTEDVTELTLEANPDDITPDYCRQLRRLTPVNRISMGVQSLDNGQLKAVGRRHSAGDALEAFRILRSAGFDNISLDLIYGLPGQTLESWKASLEAVLDLNPEHLSAYLLSFEEGTPLFRLREKGYVEEASDETAIRMYDLLCELTASRGFEHYEISNFARPGFKSRHNSSYWDVTPYLGLGPSAHSLTRGVRSHNTKETLQYANIPDVETLDEQFNDVVITSLRTSEGLSLPEVASRFGEAYAAELKEAARRCGLETGAGNRLVIPESRWIVADRILVELLRV